MEFHSYSFKVETPEREREGERVCVCVCVDHAKALHQFQPMKSLPLGSSNV